MKLSWNLVSIEEILRDNITITFKSNEYPDIFYVKDRSAKKINELNPIINGMTRAASD